MIALDYTVIIQIVAFLVLWLVLTRFLFRPVLGLLEERERRTEGVKAETASLLDEGERLKAQYEDGVKKAWDEANAAKEAIVAEGRQARERLLSQAREESARLLERVRDEIRRDVQKGRELAAREAEGVARQITEKILGRRIG
ncbi:MAG: ATP synthase F0 subunit B [Deltaproteobacteria bacterium]|nr:ATP synthase F0 subunit B [Deltaproteobacteria bacterium]